MRNKPGRSNYKTTRLYFNFLNYAENGQTKSQKEPKFDLPHNKEGLNLQIV